ncbi:hypothetical protein C1J03_09300 [Sulfitobacter sp. SK012]|nr:hypothetical protein C1J03_09300 [Sulfitobacter sp. SK012]
MLKVAIFMAGSFCGLFAIADRVGLGKGGDFGRITLLVNKRTIFPHEGKFKSRFLFSSELVGLWIKNFCR